MQLLVSNLMRFKPYWQLMRFDKPIGIYLLLWPTLWGLWAAANGLPNWPILSIFIVGTVLMRAAGCVINDIADRNFDHQVTRTQNRPLTSGQVSLAGALLLFFLLISMAFVLVLFLNYQVILLAFVAAILAIVYPFTKRFFQAPQAILGIAFAWSIPMAYAAVTNTLPWSCWWLFCIALLWPIAYDTMYALVDQTDDQKIGIRSSAILFGKYVQLIVGLLQIIIVVNLLLFGWFMDYKFMYFLIIFCASLLFIYQQVLIKNPIDKTRCFRAFLNNHWFGLLVFIAFVLAM